MKSRLLSVLVLCLFHTLNGQQFQSVFGKTETNWNYIPFGACDYVVSDSAICRSNITFNDTTYNIVCQSNDTLGFLREDTISGKLWFKNRLLGTEYLIMDLSLQKNDTFLLFSYTVESIPIRVDTTFILYGRKHIKFKDSEINMCSINEKLEFIEGIGPNGGFFYQGRTNNSSISSYLLCAYKDNIQIYTNTLFEGSCNIMDVGVEKRDNNSQIKIFPNPTKGEISFQIENSNGLKYNIIIYSIDGKLLRSNTTSNNLIKINLEAFEKGVYYYKILNTDKILNSGCIMKE